MLLLSLLAACSAPLTGVWTGDIPCGDEDADGVIPVELELSKIDATTYIGTGQIGFEGEFEINGQWQEYVSTQWLEELEARLEEPRGAQEVELTADVVDCETTIGGQPSDQGCGNDSIEWTLQWDGADTMSYDEGDCSGDITRQ